MGHSFVPIEDLNPGDWIIAHDGQPHRVLRTIHRYHQGTMAINPHKHLCAKNVRLIGLSGHPATGYRPSLLQMLKYHDCFRFDEVVTHRYPLEQTAAAIEKAMSDDCMKVAIAPWD